MIKVMCFGAFDGLHKGHLSYLRQAKKYGDYLIVVVARDESIVEIKNHAPKFSQKERLNQILEADMADKAVIGNKKMYEVLHKYQPEVICLGYDQKADTINLQKIFPNIKIIRLKAYKPKKYKSSLLNFK